MTDSIVKLNWYSEAYDRDARERAEIALRAMKELEEKFKEERKVVTEKSEYGGIIKRYVKK